MELKSKIRTFIVFSLAAALPALAQQTIAPFKTSQINTDLFVNMGAGSPYTTIQKTVTAACALPGAATVVILPASNPSDTIAAVTGGCNQVGLLDYRALPMQTYQWNAGAYTNVSPGGSGGGPFANPGVLYATSSNTTSIATGAQIGAAFHCTGAQTILSDGTCGGASSVLPAAQGLNYAQTASGVQSTAAPCTTAINCVSPIAQGEANSDLFQTGSGNNGAANALTAGQTDVTIPANSTSTEVAPVPLNTGTVNDYRGGNRVHISTSPTPIGSNDWSPNFKNCNFAKQLGLTITDFTVSEDYCDRPVLLSPYPGWNRGNIPHNGGWHVTDTLGYSGFDASAGISAGLSGQLIKTGVGDVNNIQYLYGYGGQTATADEGLGLFGARGGEADSTFTGTVSVGYSTSDASITVPCSSDCGQFDFAGPSLGVGRYLTDKSHIQLDSFATSFTTGTSLVPAVLPIHDAVTPSTAWATVNADNYTALVPDPPYTTATSLVVNIISGSFAVNDIVCFADQHEQTRITAASTVSGGQQTITLPLHTFHIAGAWVMANGPCGTGIEFSANEVEGGLGFPIDVDGATDAHTLRTASFDPGNLTWEVLNVQGNMSNTGGIVSMGIPNNLQFLLAQPFVNTASITIANATNTNFNGLCTSTVATTPITLTCHQTSSTGMTDNSGTATLTVGTTGSGNTHFVLYPIAAVWDVRHSVANPVIDGTFHIEPNLGTFTAGAFTAEQHHWLGAFRALDTTIAMHNPMPRDQNVGITANFSGSGVKGNVRDFLGGLIGIKLSNGNDVSMYSGAGGEGYPPPYLAIKGVWGTHSLSEFAPFPTGTPSRQIGCPATPLGCNDPFYDWTLDTFPLAGSGYAVIVTPATNTIDARANTGIYNETFSVRNHNSTTENYSTTQHFYLGFDFGGATPAVGTCPLSDGTRFFSTSTSACLTTLATAGNTGAAAQTGNTINIPTAFTAHGLATLVAGTVTVSTAAAVAVSSAHGYMLTPCIAGGTQGFLSVGTVAGGASFIINSSNALDTSQVCWSIY